MQNFAKNSMELPQQQSQDFDLSGALMNVIDEILGDATIKEPGEILREIVDQFGSRKEPFFKFVCWYQRNLNVRFAFNSLMIILPYETKMNLLRYAEITWPKEQYIFSRIKKILNDTINEKSHTSLNLFLHQNQNKVIHYILGKRRLNSTHLFEKDKYANDTFKPTRAFN